MTAARAVGGTRQPRLRGAPAPGAPARPQSSGAPGPRPRESLCSEAESLQTSEGPARLLPRTVLASCWREVPSLFTAPPAGGHSLYPIGGGLDELTRSGHACGTTRQPGPPVGPSLLHGGRSALPGFGGTSGNVAGASTAGLRVLAWAGTGSTDVLKARGREQDSDSRAHPAPRPAGRVPRSVTSARVVELSAARPARPPAAASSADRQDAV